MHIHTIPPFLMAKSASAIGALHISHAIFEVASPPFLSDFRMKTIRSELLLGRHEILLQKPIFMTSGNPNSGPVRLILHIVAASHLMMDVSYDVLVTGSSGHLGTALMLSLPSLGFQPFGIDILPSATTNRTGNIMSREFIASVFCDSPIKHIIHAATLHKPHVETHTKQEFVDTNVAGTLALLEAAAGLGSQIQSFIFISTTSTFGAALSPAPGVPAAWIDESVVPQPKNIYGVTKVLAEDLCFLLQKQTRIPILVLKMSRFFPEGDDDEVRRAAMEDDNLKVLELAHRRVDIADAVTACVCAMKKAKGIKWGKYIISAPPPFSCDKETLAGLDKDAQEVIERVCPAVRAVFEQKNWKYLRRFDRVYDSRRAVKDLEWQPRYSFEAAVELIGQGQDWRSNLTHEVGKRGYHAVTTGVYTQR